MFTKPVRMYLMLLFIAVAGVGSYLILKQYNDDTDASKSLNGQSVKSTLPTATPTVSPTIDSTSLNTSTEATELENLLSSVPDSDFDVDALSTGSLGL